MHAGIDKFSFLFFYRFDFCFPIFQRILALLRTLLIRSSRKRLRHIIFLLIKKKLQTILLIIRRDHKMQKKKARTKVNTFAGSKESSI